MDALSSFTHLTTNLPDWISQIEKLTVHSTQKRAEFAAEYTRLLQHAKPKRLKSPSITSIHSSGQNSIEKLHVPPTAEDARSQTPEFTEISPFEAGNKYLYAQARRKRKPTSSVRSGASGPQKFRSKQSVVIYYDAVIQEQLHDMVKNIASARNSVRKGKRSYTVHKGLQLPTVNRRFPEIYHSSSEDVKLPQMQSTNSLPADTKAVVAEANSQTDDGFFCQADKDLENAQALCETAAHQFLRDGDCKVELEGVKSKLESVLTLATKTVTRLKLEKEAEDEKDEVRTDSESTLNEEPTINELFTTAAAKFTPNLNHVTSPSSPLSLPQPTSFADMNAVAIEVDDDDGSSMEVDITQFRSIRTRAGAEFSNAKRSRI